MYQKYSSLRFFQFEGRRKSSEFSFFRVISVEIKLIQSANRSDSHSCKESSNEPCDHNPRPHDRTHKTHIFLLAQSYRGVIAVSHRNSPTVGLFSFALSLQILIDILAFSSLSSQLLVSENIRARIRQHLVVIDKKTTKL